MPEFGTEMNRAPDRESGLLRSAPRQFDVERDSRER